MAVATFDTLKFSKALREAGVSEKHAEAEATVLSEVFSINFKDIATKDDLKSELKSLEERFDYKLKDAEQRLSAKIELLDAKIERSSAKHTGEINLLKWMLGASMSIMVAVAIRLFFFPVK